MLVTYGPCKTCIAWLVTEPELLAIGLAVALTPPTLSAQAVPLERKVVPLMTNAAAVLDIFLPYLPIA